MIEQTIQHAHAQYDPYMANFKELLRIPSVSTDPAYKADVERTAAWVRREMERIGFERAQVIPTAGHPAIYGEWLHAGPERPTVLVYAHYDVQPVDPLELWATPPFEPTLVGDKLVGRGTIDDKGGVYFNLKAFESMMAVSGGLPVNVKLIFEGMEEAGSIGMDDFIREHRDLLAADFLVISDGGHARETPIVLTGVRGIVGAEVRVTGPQVDVHSGSLGGAVHNPLHKMAAIIASFHDENGHILIPGYYDDVRPPTPEEKRTWAAREEDLIDQFKAVYGDFRVWGEPNTSFDERSTARPTLDVNGIYGGYQGEGGKTIIPAAGGFKVTMRLVPDQDPEDIVRKFEAHVTQHAEPTVDIHIQMGQAYRPSLMLHDGGPVRAAQRAFSATWGRPAILRRNGGSIPIISMFEEHLGLPITSLGMGTGGRGHSPNEFLWVEHFQRGIDTAIHYYYYLAEEMG